MHQQAVAHSAPNVRLKSIALPAEHGSWGFLLEPMILGLLVRPSWAGLALCVGVFGAFLAHQPLKIALKDRQRGKRYPRTAYAERFAALYIVIAFAGLGIAALLADHAFWLPLLLAVPLAGVQLVYELRSEGRALLPELLGASALGASASAVVLASGLDLLPALLLWVLVALRVVPSILYVRARLRRARGQEGSLRAAIEAHVAALLLVVGLAFAAGWTGAVVVASALLLGRLFLWGWRVQPAKIVGMQEVILGLAYAVLVALGVA
jgi:hypothetical protein